MKAIVWVEAIGDRGEYPENWDLIARRIKYNAGFQCEHCGHPHDPEAGYALTVHHLDRDKSNCADDNLVALCQRCHLHIQARFLPGQLVMSFARPGWMVARGLGI
jgi:5-methylcytosine-specific restriction endonuclease McrA